MAEQNQKDDIEVVAEGKGNSKLLIIIAVVVIALIGVGAMMFLGGDDEKETDETSEEATAPIKQAPIYHTVETPFVVNFADQSNGEVRYLQIKLKVMARSQAVIDAFQLHDPALQHELLLLFYGQIYDDLNTSAGTKALQQATLDKINEILSTDPTLSEQLEAVYFTSLIMQ
ncbi:flagellar basal body protein FliL [Methylophaga sp. 41_12_T18]|nr:flagellar basal body protein FliL [Methylophaga sp. 41_12_T18]